MQEHRLLALPLLAAILTAPAALAHDGDPKLLDKQPAYQGPGWRNALKRQFATGGGQQQLGVGDQFARSNVTLLAWMPLSDFGVASGGNGNSCFGYTSPSGREYALFGHSNGTAIVEVTQPGNPVIVGQIAGPQSLWRDVRSFGTYAYAGSEGGGGIQVINLANVDNGVVTLANTITTGGTLATHTLALNPTSGRLYRDGGGSNGLRIYDLNANPASPTYLGAWSDRYVHESQVVTYPTGGPGGGPRELAICCGGLGSGYTDTGIDIVDVSNAAAPVHLLHVAYGLSNYSHQAWLSPDRQFLFHNDEVDGRPFTRVFNAANLNLPVPQLTYIGEYQNGVTVDHNLYTKGSLVYHANYRSGLRVFDTASGVTTPTLRAWFDTYPADDATGYNGLWNNYPYFPSGVVIGSDIENGFFVWWVGDPQIAFAFPQSAPTQLNPAGDATVVQILQNTPGILQAGTPTLYWSTGGAYTPVPLSPLGGDLYSAVFPSFPCGTTVNYYISATGTNGIVWTAPEGAPGATYTAQASLGTTSVASADFEANAGGFARDTATDTATAGLWVRANPIGSAEQTEDDHTAGAGVNCWFTGQGTVGGGVGDADVDGGRTTLLSNTYNLASYTNPVVSYWRWYVNDGNTVVDDSFRVDVSNNGTTWVNVETLGPGNAQASGGWYRREFRVTDFVALTGNVRVRFVAEDLGTGSIVEAAIDDFAIVEAVCVGYEPFCAGDGSGGACPCGNTGSAGAGCANSTGTSGLLAGSGTVSVGADTFALSVSGLPATVSVLFFQGTSAQNGGLGAAFGDGLRCASGSVVRLGTKLTAAGASSYPQGGDLSVSVRGGVTAGNTRTYQAWYRNAANFCTSDTFNLTNGVSVLWGS
ncbi:MAG: choice-of-anchor B family protein [Planctomycetota bacterium]|nr:choice-of-anchor B family protein [Planctomycetota bacterium]